MKNEPIFEHGVCGRCGGSGHYSFNQVDGTRCYGCAGTGFKLTKRGSAASEYFRQLRTRTTSQLEVGMIVLDNFPKLRWVRIEEITPSHDGFTNISCNGIMFASCRPEQKFVIGLTPEQKADYIAQALKFQNTLTKAGKPKK